MVTLEYLKNLLLNGHDISDLDYSHITDMSYMFSNNDFLIFVPDFDTSHVVNMEGMFYGCRNLGEIPNIDTSNCTNMKDMFRGCFELTEIPPLNTSKVENMEGMFRDCGSLQFVPPLDMLNVKSACEMFYYCFDIHFDMPSWKINEKLDLFEITKKSFQNADDFVKCIGLDNCVKIIIDNNLTDPFFVKVLSRKNYDENITDKIVKIIDKKIISS